LGKSGDVFKDSNRLPYRVSPELVMILKYGPLRPHRRVNAMNLRWFIPIALLIPLRLSAPDAAVGDGARALSLDL